jgi:ABC-type cobalamin/Fe3+-siderophores transport system ATPase subunit
VRIEYSLSNYRCFPDGNRAEIVIEPGFTSFIGVNNAGKSTLLRSLYELRSFFGNLSQPTAHWIANLDQPQAIEFYDVPDADDVFADNNDRDMQITIAIPDAESQVAGVGPVQRLSFNIGRLTKRYSLLITAAGSEIEPRGWVNSGATQQNVLQASDSRMYDVGAYHDAFAVLANTLYLGAFRNAMNVGAGDRYYDLVVGQRFISTWNEFKTGSVRKSREAARRVERDLGQIFELEELDLSASSDGTTLIVSVGTKSYTLQELGAGFAQFVVVLAYVATRAPALILIDEPELNLHPALQVDFLNTLGSLSSAGVLFATHELGLARSASDRIYTVRRVAQGEGEVRPFEGAPHLGEILGELNFSGYQALGFSGVLLVEGPTELRTVQRLLRLYRADHKIVLLPLGGGQLVKGDARVELQELRRLTTKTFALIDSEKRSVTDPVAQDRLDFAAVCADEGIECHILERRAMENYFAEHAVQAAKGTAWRALAEYERPKDSGMPWSKTRDNWRIAQEMTRAELDATDLGTFLWKVAQTST